MVPDVVSGAHGREHFFSGSFLCPPVDVAVGFDLGVSDRCREVEIRIGGPEMVAGAVKVAVGFLIYGETPSHVPTVEGLFEVDEEVNATGHRFFWFIGLRVLSGMKLYTGHIGDDFGHALHFRLHVTPVLGYY